MGEGVPHFFCPPDEIVKACAGCNEGLSLLRSVPSQVMTTGAFYFIGLNQSFKQEFFFASWGAVVYKIVRVYRVNDFHIISVM
jgi:hypothetical protein